MKDTGSLERSAAFMQVLKFWHRLEFFIPYDLTKRVEPSDRKRVFWLREGGLEDQIAELSAYSPPEGKRITSAHLFAGVFPMAEIERFSRELVPGDAKGSAFDEAERGLPEGRSCCARFGLDAELGLISEGAEVSTLPWAMGQARKKGLAVLSDAAFWQSQERLKDDLHHVMARAAAAPAGVFDAACLRELVAVLEAWAGFDLPRGETPVACVEINLGAARPEATKPKNGKPSAAKEGDEDDDPVGEAEEAEIGILNSFFITDLERAMDHLNSGAYLGALQPYLAAAPVGASIDLYGADGAAALLDGLAPQLSNRGRWMSPPAHAMSLMQQFAINKAISLRADKGLFSVNGPPGTGKTTLLRDIIADNLVARAEVLSRYVHASDAFEPQKTAFRAATGEPTWVSVLKPELRGYGMVVASSNNAAVENISRDLPKASSIEAAESFGYLQPVAYKLVAQKDDGRFETLSPGDTPWGLIAAALGKKANRRKFAQRVFRKVEGAPPPGAAAAPVPQTIWQWRDGYAGPGFAEAARAFRAQSDRLEIQTREATRFAELSVLLASHTPESFVAEFRQIEQEASRGVTTALEHLDAARERVTELHTRLEHLQEVERLLHLARPHWWARLLGTQESRDHRADIADNVRKQLSCQDCLCAAQTDADKTCPARLQRAKDGLRKASADLQTAENRFQQMAAELQALLGKGYTLPEGALTDLDQDSLQISGLWHHHELAKARSELTAAALTLHEAWLAEVSRKGGGFGSNLVAISQFLDGRSLTDPAPIWESLFMIVPVISTTFASFARQFEGMGPGTLGWVFIDEAGQSVPQAAVGALMRARRAVVIGDPLQIEPVFTLPKALIGALAELSSETAEGNWSPDSKSVQIIADRSNRFGARIVTEGDTTIWIGSPLRVHRRCSDPMFSLANAIAYQGKMVFGAKERLAKGDVVPRLGESAWIDLPGQVAGKQTVPEQADFIAELLSTVSRQNHKLPDLYVISPFKEVAGSVKDALRKIDWAETGVTKSDLLKWLAQRVGTVHTFQGKEEDTVFMVLGGDAAHSGAATWAASKPNLLNVALTRAKKRFYAVGDRALWSQMSGFDLVARALPVLTPQEALCRVQDANVADQIF